MPRSTTPAGTDVTPLLSLSRLIDRISEWIGRWVAWLVLGAVLISALNAVVRKAFNTSSNAYLEIQWYLFAAVFLLAAGYTMLRQEHVRIDVISGRFSKRTQIWIDIVGLAAFVLPLVWVVIHLSLPLAVRAHRMGEYSQNAGGLIRWPVFALLPLGFALLGMQAISELIKRIAFLRGLIPDPTQKGQAKSAEEELAEFLLQKEVAEREKAALAGKP
jgi:TRAP-type mannitol/chloroaromatic compound transport system permease small subunit